MTLPLNYSVKTFTFRKILLIIILITSCLLSPASLTHAYELTGIPEQPTCDLCGKCRDAGGLEQKPPDWDGCHTCLYDPVTKLPVQNKTWTPIGCVGLDVGQPAGFVQTVLKFVMGIAGGLAFLGCLWGGFQLLTSRGDPMQITAGKGMLMSSLGALFLVFFSIFILKFIGVDILALPGFG